MTNRREAPVTPDRPGRVFLNFSPKHINDYRACPEQFYWRHIKREWVRKQFARPLEIGGATHRALAFVWHQQLAGFEEPDDLARLASIHLRQSNYPPDEQEKWPDDVATVAGHVERCLRALDGEKSILSVEREWSHSLAKTGSGPPLRIQSRVDLVLQRPDGIVEHVDYKTGRKKADEIQEVMSRVVVRAMLTTTGITGAQLVTSTLYAKDGTLVSDQYDRDAYRHVWMDILDAVTAIRATTVWKPSPGPDCHWCDFKDLCSIQGAGQIR